MRWKCRWRSWMELLRVTEEGRFAHTPHPFPGHPHIVRDFSENQTEINTGISATPEEAVAELEHYTNEIYETLKMLPDREYLWLFSNPPFIEKESDIPIAQFYGEQAKKTKYREYLSDRYGRYKMSLCGIHVNYSFGEELLEAAFSESAMEFYQGFKGEVLQVLAFEEEKLVDPEKRYAWQIRRKYGKEFAKKGMELAKERAGK